MPRAPEKIICVDDDQNVLDAFERLFRMKFNIVTCQTPRLALDIIAEQGPFAVIVSDMRMPDMDGIRFLSIAASTCPETARIMLTGVQDQKTAIDAVNEGQIFRFLSKPCAAEQLLKTVNAGIEQYKLITSERVLLQQTLRGAVQMLTDILSLTNPVAFSRAMRLRKYAAQVAKIMHVEDSWQIEVAAMLSQTGHVTVPAEILEKHSAGETLSGMENKILNGAYDISSSLLANIPRLDSVSAMIRNQRQPHSFFRTKQRNSEHAEETGSQILKACHDFDMLIGRGYSSKTAVAEMEKTDGAYHPEVLNALRNIHTPKMETATRMVRIQELRMGMILAEDICATNGLLVVPAGHEINSVLQRRLENFLLQKRIPAEIRASIPV